jgi:Tol biopolymer transport system component
MKATRLTANGKVSAIDLSPDAKYITYTTVESDGRESLWIKQVLSGGTLQLISPTFFEILGTTFSPDGTLIYYAARSKDSPTGALYKIPTIGGSSKRVLTDIAGAVGIARDATRLAFVRAKKDRTELFTANTDGTDVRELAERAGSEWFAREGPAWSPDSRTIACGGGSHAHGNVSTVYAVDAATGNVRELTPHTWAVVYRVAWVADGSALVLIGKEEGGGLSQVWKISLPSGEVTRVTSDLSGHGSISLGVSADATALVTEKNDTLSKLWVVPADGNTTNARQVISGADREDGHYGLAWTPDGRIVYTSTAGGFQDIWVTDADGGHQQQLTSDSYVDYAPAVSPDGRYIVFKTERRGDLLYLSHLWRMDIDGSNLRQLTNGNDHIPRWSPDSRWVVYASLADDGYDRLWRVPVDGGAQERLSPLKAQWPDISPDGSSIACALFDEQLDAPRWRIAILPASGDSPSKIFDYRSPGIRRVHWSPDGRALVYTETNAGVSNLWRQAVNGGAPTRLTDFNSDLIFHFDFSPDGQWLACSRGVNNSDAILLSNFP